MKESSRPGVMIYFDDIRPFADYMTDEVLGAFIRALIDYAQFGEWVDDDCDPNVVVPLRIFKPKVDRDAEAYESKKLHGQYMTYVRLAKQQGLNPVSEEAWRASIRDGTASNY